MKGVLTYSEFQGKLYYAQYANTVEYVQLTRQTAALVIEAHAKGEECSTIVYVDGLTKDGARLFNNYLRQDKHISRCKVQGRTDDNDCLIRLADSLAGFVRDSLDGRKPHKQLWEKALREGWIIEVREK